MASPTLTRAEDLPASVRPVSAGHPALEAACAYGSAALDATVGALTPVAMRDALLAAWMGLPVAPAAAARVARAWAEAPGPTDGNAAAAAAQFVMLTAELRRWGVADDVVAGLLPAVDRALDLITQQCDHDHDGLAEAPGTDAAPAELQAYVYGAFRARADLARAVGDRPRARCWDDAADGLAHRFDQAFWVPDWNMYAGELDSAKQPVSRASAAIGHALFTGLVLPRRAEAVGRHLLSAEMLTAWGVRSRGVAADGHDSLGYRDGCVRLHENALIAAGLARYGLTEEATRVIHAVLVAVEAFGGRAPERFKASGGGDFRPPLAWPAGCTWQASASAAPLLLVRTMLGLAPDVPEGVVRVAPNVPPEVLPLTHEVLLGGERTTVHAVGWRDRGRLEVTGLPRGVRVVRGPE